MFDLFLIPVAPIYHYSFTHIYSECPVCHSINSDNGFNCSVCGQSFTYDESELEKVAIYTKPYLAAKILGFSGGLTEEQIMKCKIYAQKNL